MLLSYPAIFSISTLVIVVVQGLAPNYQRDLTYLQARTNEPRRGASTFPDARGSSRAGAGGAQGPDQAQGTNAPRSSGQAQARALSRSSSSSSSSDSGCSSGECHSGDTPSSRPRIKFKVRGPASYTSTGSGFRMDSFVPAGGEDVRKIYASHGKKAEVTITPEAGGLAQVIARGRNRARVNIASTGAQGLVKQMAPKPAVNTRIRPGEIDAIESASDHTTNHQVMGTMEGAGKISGIAKK